MIHGFDIDENLICEGIVGDGCGGGRLFFVEEGILSAFDPITKEKRELLSGIKNPIKVTKKGCDLFIECQEERIEFNLSSMSKTVYRK